MNLVICRGVDPLLVDEMPSGPDTWCLLGDHVVAAELALVAGAAKDGVAVAAVPVELHIAIAAFAILFAFAAWVLEGILVVEHGDVSLDDVVWIEPEVAVPGVGVTCLVGDPFADFVIKPGDGFFRYVVEPVVVAVE